MIKKSLDASPDNDYYRIIKAKSKGNFSHIASMKHIGIIQINSKLIEK
jgi:hypothetical protein